MRRFLTPFLLVAVLLSGSAALFTMCEGGPVPAGCCEHGDQLNVIMGNNSGWVTRCLNMGGEPIFDPRTQIAWCEDVDF